MSISSGGTGAPGSPGPGKLFRSTSSVPGIPVTTRSFGSSEGLETLLKLEGGESLGTVEWKLIFITKLHEKIEKDILYESKQVSVIKSKTL